MRYGPAQIGPRIRNEGRAPPRLPECRRRCLDICKVPLRSRSLCMRYIWARALQGPLHDTLRHARGEGHRPSIARLDSWRDPLSTVVPFHAHALALKSCSSVMQQSVSIRRPLLVSGRYVLVNIILDMSLAYGLTTRPRANTIIDTVTYLVS